jgi:DNA-binding NarL/FixJ family response regulator
LEDLLSSDDLRRVLRVLEAAERPRSVAGFSEATVDALQTEFGYRGVAFFVTGPLGERMQPTDAAVRGMPADHAEAWQEYWGQFEPFSSHAAVALQRRYGTADLEQIHARLGAMERRYVTDFLRPAGIEAQLAFHLDTGLRATAQGSIARGDGARFGPVNHARLRVLRPHLANLLRQRLLDASPPANTWGLTERESQVLDLLVTGIRDRDIAEELGVSTRTVSKHLQAVYRKLSVSTRAAAVAVALKAAGRRPD